MFCKKCGNQNADTSKFCFGCGEVLEQANQSEDFNMIIATSLGVLDAKSVNLNIQLLLNKFNQLN